MVTVFGQRNLTKNLNPYIPMVCIMFKEEKMNNRNFVMVVVGQIISLFGNAVLRFVLPLYLLSETGSAALFGIVSACAFIPMIVLGPVGGIFADRVNKRNIMVILDFSTALLVLFILCLLGKMDVVALIFTALFILYGIQGAYQPAVQASIPALLSNEHIMQGNAAINMILSALMIIGLPVIVTQLLAFDSETANRLYGYAEGVMAVGSLCGGMGAGMFASRMKPEKGYLLLFYDAFTLIPIGCALMLPVPATVSYVVIMISCFFMMFLATLFSIQIMSYLQMIVPEHLIGKVISCAMCIGMCATPIGQAIYGGLFEVLKEKVSGLFFIVTVIVVLLAFAMKKPFARLAELFAERENIKTEKMR